MLHRLYSFYDCKALSFSQPFCIINDYEAIRAFYSLCSDPESKMCVYPEDYQLFHLGTLDDTSGELTPSIPTKLATGLEARAHFTQLISDAKKLHLELTKMNDDNIPTLSDVTQILEDSINEN